MKGSACDSPYEKVKAFMKKSLKEMTAEEETAKRTVEIPVCYGGSFGPDLEEVARINGLTPEEVIEIHTSGEYLVYMIGFAPGFPYLGGMSEKIAAPYAVFAANVYSGRFCRHRRQADRRLSVINTWRLAADRQHAP